MTPQELMSYDIKNKCAWLTIQRPGRLNALSVPLLDVLHENLIKAEHDSAARVIILTGAGEKAFCAGADIDSFYNETQASVDEHEFKEKLLRLFETMMKLSKPTIARVNGYALGGGFGLAMGCDLVVASNNAKFGTPEINIGIFPMMIMPALARNIGRKKLLEMMFTGDKVKAEEAERLGMINACVPPEQLDDAVETLAAKLAQKSGNTLKLGREAFYTMSEMNTHQALNYLKGMLSQNLHTQDAQEGLKAFLEKRAPVWSDA